MRSTARSKAASFAFDGLLNPESFLTNCTDDAKISSDVAGGSKLNNVLIFLHITLAELIYQVSQGRIFGCDSAPIMRR